MLICTNLNAQAIYDVNGQYRGYQQTTPSGVTTTYSPQGVPQGTSTAPVYMSPNTTLGFPRQAPQAPVIKGW